MKFKNRFRWTKDDYNEVPISKKYDENWMHERFDEGPPSGKGKGFPIMRIIDLVADLIRRMIK